MKLSFDFEFLCDQFCTFWSIYLCITWYLSLDLMLLLPLVFFSLRFWFEIERWILYLWFPLDSWFVSWILDAEANFFSVFREVVKVFRFFFAIKLSWTIIIQKNLFQIFIFVFTSYFLLWELFIRADQVISQIFSLLFMNVWLMFQTWLIFSFERFFQQ